jgi:hypothetical protein
MNSRLSLLPLLAAALLAGCGGGVVIGGVGPIDCEGPMAALTGRLGFPEQVDRRFDGGLQIETFFYVRSGIAIAFSWGADVSCQQREFTIDPRAPRPF